jgi:two-component sensor histidine kinase
LLSEATWTELPLREVISARLAPHPTGDAANVAALSGPSVLLKPRAALFLSMVFHELTANAAKYGALSVSDGRIEVDWGGNGNPPDRLQLTWSEQGGPRIEALTKRGFGADLIEKGIRFELEGDATLEIVDGALRCRIGLPARLDLLTFGTASPRSTG